MYISTLSLLGPEANPAEVERFCLEVIYDIECQDLEQIGYYRSVIIFE
jgi:hypothetical protein